ncbi:hypothetical protein PVK06_028103 [Gossypium arboreum]|uniref:Uncharacterized protein n=1 Tax=Gossypium arboreum TaxID=29729 RepID=A0ABR0P4B2_GOSAR|nr:hypothetical protein PVK06_028103 [Gossypium arboreum]
MHGRWDASYNKVWESCQVLERYVSGCMTDLEMALAYYNDRLLRECQVFKPVAQDGSGRIIPIAFTITPGESADDWDFFLSRLRRHVCPQPDKCVISDRGTRILAVIERQGSQ